jgi:putative restriction endonuclease
MSLKEFLMDDEWDAPFFKCLAHNDTGRAVGNQGGIVVPKNLRKFFPLLDLDVTSKSKPTTDRILEAELFIGETLVAKKTSRYQLQTWGGERKETRLTSNLGPLLNEAKESDLLIFQRRRNEVKSFRLVLIKAASSDFLELREEVNGRRWGNLFENLHPAGQQDVEFACAELLDVVKNSFHLFKSSISKTASLRMRIAREVAFAVTVRRQYKQTCCVSGSRIATPAGLCEIEAAHVVPVAAEGTDDPRNGIALTRTLHWAFDRGLFGIDDDRRVYLPRQVRKMNDPYLQTFEGHKIREALDRVYRVDSSALAWHLQTCVKPLD